MVCRSSAQFLGVMASPARSNIFRDRKNKKAFIEVYRN
jgi:hypothetical protein